MIGIYKIENLINKKVYIGKSKDIEQRFYRHKHYSQNDLEKSQLYKDMAQYGIENFAFDIIQECSKDELNDLEIMFIEKYKARNPLYGYNKAKGGSYTALENELNHNSKLSNADVYNIREMYNNRVSKKDVFALFQDKISKNTFQDIWIGKTWNNIHMDVYTPENKKYHINNYDKYKSHEHEVAVTKEQVKNIRDLKNSGKYTKMEVQQIFDFINPNTFADIWQGNTFKYIQSDVLDNYTKYSRIPKRQDGELNACAKLKNEEVKKIREYKDKGYKPINVYRLLNLESAISRSAFYNIWNEKVYKNI